MSEPRIIPFDDTPIVDESVMERKMTSEVESLKESLIIGQVGWIKAGKHLCELQKDDLYQYEDSSHDISWGEFLDKPELPFPGGTTGSRKRIAQKLMTSYRTFVEQYQIDEVTLSEVGYTKLAIVASALRKDATADVNEWLDKAKELSTKDLQAEVSDGGSTLADALTCKHANLKTFKVTKCPDCGLYEKEEIK